VSRGVPFSISIQAIVIPPFCPVLGIPIVLGEQRSENSPSLDRITPRLGYVPGNVRVISDKANRLKGDRTLGELQQKAINGPLQFRDDYRLIADYVRRELVFGEVRQKLIDLGATREDWKAIAELLDRLSTRASDGAVDSFGVEVRTQLTSEMIEEEFGLTKSEVRMLRRLAGFPRPIRKRDGFRFVRAEVQEWIAAQPDPGKPAAVLSRHKRPRVPVNSKAARLLQAQYFGAPYPPREPHTIDGRSQP
jgi:predicted DNA-binding transcriptional regulator AlpA